MGLFSAPKTAAGPAVTMVDRRRPAQGGLSIVAKDLTIAGDLQAAGVIRIEGRVIGNVHAGDQVLISEGGIVEGDVAAREAVVGGRVHGCIQGRKRTGASRVRREVLARQVEDVGDAAGRHVR